MKKLLVIVLIFMFAGIAYAEDGFVELTQWQYDNIGIISTYLKDKYPQFQGFEGSKDKMNVFGLPVAAVEEELDTVDFLAIRTEEIEMEIEEKKITDKMFDIAVEAIEDDGYTFKHLDKIKDKKDK